MRSNTPVIAFSHLRWNFVYQRPQHLLSRIAGNRPVYFIEEPIHDAHAPAHWVRIRSERNLTVLQPHTPISRPGFCDEQLSHLHTLMSQFLESEELHDYAVWFYTPMALP